MFSKSLLLSVDTNLGRLDYSLLSDQALMEMLIDGFDDDTKKQYQDDHGMYLDVCEWSCIECDADERVAEIVMDNSDIRGSIQLCYVPPKVEEIDIGDMWVNGKLAGSVDLTLLPEGMEVLNLLGNKLSGEIDLTQLPYKMEYLTLGYNQLTGEINLTHLPDGMRGLHLESNQLSGSLVIRGLPQEMNIIDVRGNNFNAVAVVDSDTPATIKLKESGVTSVVDENGREQDMI